MDLLVERDGWDGFFFKRGDHDRENASPFFNTVALDLVRQMPELTTYLHRAIDEVPGIARKALKEQSEKLIYQPLVDVGPSSSARPVLVIDALDECDWEGMSFTYLWT